MSDVVFVGGGPWQLHYVEFLKRKGHRVHVVNPVASETVKAAGHHIPLDTRCSGPIAQYLHEHRIEPLLVTSDQSDVATLTVAELAARFGLPGNTPEAALLFSDKARMYEFAQRQGLPLAPFIEASGADEVREFVREHGVPIIVKPTRATASRGFARIETTEQIEPAVALALRYSPTKTFIAQTYIGGEGIVELTAEGMCVAGKHRTLTTSLRAMHCAGINSSLRYPSGLPVQRLAEASDRFVAASGLTLAPTHAEYFLNVRTGEFWLTEIAARGGGVGIASYAVPWVTGLDPCELLYENLIGRPTPCPPAPRQRPALMQFFHRDDMERLTPAQIEEIGRIAGVFFHNYRRHDFIRGEKDDLNRRHSLAILLRETDGQIDADLRAIVDVMGGRWMWE